MWVNGFVFLWSFRSLFEALVFLQLHNFKSILEKCLLGWNDGSSGKNKTNVCKAFKSRLVMIYSYQTSPKLEKCQDAWSLISGCLGGLSLILGSRPLLLRCTALWRSWRTGRCCSSLTDWAVWKVADHIIFLREGEVAEEGKHEELMAKHGFYEEFVNQQNTSIHRNTEDPTNSSQWSRPAALHLIWASTNPCIFSPLAHISQLFNYANATSVFKLGVNITKNARKDMGESH